jgi:hypothetical protein
VEFFIPHIPDPDYAEKIWQETRSFMGLQGSRQVTDQRIFRLEYEHNGKQWEAEIGQPHPYGHPVTSWETDYVPDYDDPKAGQWVVVILENEGGPYLVCTQDRGVLHGEPIRVGLNEVREVVYFDGYGPNDN